MKRRHSLRWGAGLLGGLLAGSQPAVKGQTLPLPPEESGNPNPAPPAPPTDGLSLTWLNHSCVLFESGSFRILVNPFRSVGCTAGYPPPAVAADLVLLSSRLFDEGALEVVPGNPRVLFSPGDYQVGEIRLQGVRMAHDATTSRGDRFGVNVGWRWQQAGIDIVHLGGAAAPITREQEILLAKPDVLLIPVGGGPKNYDPAGAQAAIATLQPKLVIPTMYRTGAASPDCELVSVEEFLQLYPDGMVQPALSNPLLITPASVPATGSLILTFGG
ncbi:MAG: MBL fold metallo-hydrolase [Cyanobacteriota bacterium]|nr:MBL fold metallo-hydrolase [Cyanobacteriota bacterium]